MLKVEILNKLNEQINLENYSSNLYLAMSSWCSAKGLEGSVKFLLEHSKEELGHMYKLFSYINETGSMAQIEAIAKPEFTFSNIKDVFVKTFEHEQFITKKINELVDITLLQKDYSTFNFLQWYVREQHEEEALFKTIVDKMEIIGLEGRGLHIIDKEIGQLLAK